MTKKSVLIVIVGFLCCLYISAVQAQETLSLHIVSHDDHERIYWLNIPDSAPASDRSAIIALHPTASSGRAMQLLAGLDDAAAQVGFLTVYPDSLEIAWGEDPAESTVNDVGFLTNLITHLKSEFAVTNVFLTGFGNGGLMAYRAACEIPEHLARASPSLARSCGIIIARTALKNQRLSTYWSCLARMTISTNTRLTNSPHFLVASHPSSSGVEDTMNFWAQRQACDGEPQSPNENVAQLTSCADGTTIAVYRVIGGGQNWPRVRGLYT